ncbi:MAG TPA: VWA domain-containing protein [Candidatus Dormibacteraeota bacterium]
MTFAEPLALLAIPVLPLLAAFYIVARMRRRRYALRFTNLALLASVAGRGPGIRRHVPPVLLLTALGMLLLGLAQPILYLMVARNDARVMLVIDVSGSMQATDVAPTRLDAAVNAAHTLVDKLPPNARVGLIAFNANAQLIQPLTDNRQQVVDALGSLHANGSTAIGDAIALAVDQLKPQHPAASSARGQPASMIVLLTDGSSNTGIDPIAAAGQAQAAGIPVEAIGIGQRNASVRVRGQEVGGVDEATLQAIASQTGGHYFYAEAAGQLSQIYGALGSEFGWQLTRVNIGPELLVAGMVLVIGAAAVSLLWFRVFP